MDQKWAPDLIAEKISQYCRQKEATEGPDGKIDIIVTFDDWGVSNHPNHIAIFYGVEKLMQKKLVDVEVMTLSSVIWFRKFILIFDVNLIIMDEWQAFRYNVCEAYSTLAEHETQNVWFRKLFVLFSRYTYINSFTRYVQSHKSTSVPGSTAESELTEDPSGNGNRKKVNID